MRITILLSVLVVCSCHILWSDLLYLDTNLENRTPTLPTLPTLPNSNYLLASYDFKYGQPLITTSLKSIIFDYYTYNNGWSVVINNIEYAMPDQLYVLSDPYEDKQCRNQVFYTAEDVLESLFQSFTIGFNCKHINGTFSLSEQYEYFNEQYNMYASYTANSFTTILCSRMEFNDNIRLNKNFKYALNKLPANYTAETCNEYEKFITLYGTAFLGKARYGGYINMVSSYSITSTYGKSMKDIGIELSAKFMMMNTDNKFNWNETDIYQDLNATYNSQLKIIGGNPGLTGNEWIASVPENPLIVEGDIISLAEFLPPNSDSKTSLLAALTAYYNGELCVF